MITYYKTAPNIYHKGKVDITYYDERYTMIGQELCVDKPDSKRISIKKISSNLPDYYKFELATNGRTYCKSSQSATALKKWAKETLHANVEVRKAFDMYHAEINRD